MTALHDKTLHALRRHLDSGEVSSVEATEACLARFEATRRLGAALYVDTDGALAQARDADTLRSSGVKASNALDGVPVALKDIFLSENLPTTCGSKILEGFSAPYDGTAVARLKDAGAIIVAKLSMDEFAMGSSNEHCAYGPARNPWNTEYVPGGSSGGSAIAVATGAAFGALGTDTGGSIRQPAAYCGVVGLKPTYGRVSRYGVVAFASSLDQVGPLAKDVTDCALILQIIAGHDPLDSTSAEADVPDYLASIEKGLEGLRIGVPKEYFVDCVDSVDADVRAAVQEALDMYRKLGAELVDVSLPHTEYAVATYYLIATAEASSNLARYDGVRYGQRQDPGQGLNEMYRATRGAGFGAEVKRRIMLGTYALSAGYYDAYYLRAQKVRTLIRQDFTEVFKKVDALVTPTAPTTAFRLGENIDDPMQMYLADIFTVSCNLAGLPGVSLPCGFSGSGLPIGLQLIGRPWEEATILRAARAYERETDWHTRRPPQ